MHERGRNPMNKTILDIQNIHTFYGAVEALKGVNLTVEQGDIVSLIGANGAGKSTLLMSICGFPRPKTGMIYYDGQDLSKVQAHDLIQYGLAHVPEGRRIFAGMSVEENLILGAYAFPDINVNTQIKKIYDMFPRLFERRHQRGGTLSGGEQQMLAIGRALMGKPRLLLLDEPSLGLAPLIVKQIFNIIETINKEEKVTILLVEQNAYHALKLAKYAYVLCNGVVTRRGYGHELLGDPEVRAAYLEGGTH
jgi:branched-chain amino acid transport system ATP-binding protein